MKARYIVSVLLILILSLGLVSCGNKVSKAEAKDLTSDFLTAIASGDFEAAKAYLHPEKPIDLVAYFERKELQTGADFQNGIEITRYTDYSSSVYNSDVGGGEYELELNLIVDGIALEMSVDVVRNDLGYGIYSFEIEGADD